MPPRLTEFDTPLVKKEFETPAGKQQGAVDGVAAQADRRSSRPTMAVTPLQTLGSDSSGESPTREPTRDPDQPFGSSPQNCNIRTRGSFGNGPGLSRDSSTRQFASVRSMDRSRGVITADGVLPLAAVSSPSRPLRQTSPVGAWNSDGPGSGLAGQQRMQWSDIRAVSPNSMQRMMVAASPPPSAASRLGSPSASFVHGTPVRRPTSPTVRSFAWSPTETQRRFSGQLPDGDRPAEQAVSSANTNGYHRSPSPSGDALPVRQGSPGLRQLRQTGSQGNSFQFVARPAQANDAQRQGSFTFPRSSSDEYQSMVMPESPMRRQTQSGESIIRHISPTRPQVRQKPKDADLSATCLRFQMKLGGLSGDVGDIVHL